MFARQPTPRSEPGDSAGAPTQATSDDARVSAAARSSEDVSWRSTSRCTARSGEMTSSTLSAGRAAPSAGASSAGCATQSAKASESTDEFRRSAAFSSSASLRHDVDGAALMSGLWAASPCRMNVKLRAAAMLDGWLDDGMGGAYPGGFVGYLGEPSQVAAGGRPLAVAAEVGREGNGATGGKGGAGLLAGLLRRRDHASPGASARASGLEQFLEGASGRVLLGHVR